MTRKFILFGILMVPFCIIVTIVSFFRFHSYTHAVNEAAMTLCYNAFKIDSTPEENADIINSYLTFINFPHSVKVKLIDLIKSNPKEAEKILKEFENFEYNNANLLSLYKKIENAQLTQEVFKITKNMSSEELAVIMLKDLFNENSTFKEVRGDGESFIKRYYCSNVCIDVCENGKIRYLCDIKGENEEDLFLRWLSKGHDIEITNRTKKQGTEYWEIKSAGFIGKLCINSKTNHVFAAEIQIIS